MKTYVTLIVAAILALLVWLAFQNMELDRAQKPPPPRQDFTALETVLRQDMVRIPLSLQSPRAVPSHAFAIKSKLRGATGQHEEYVVLDRACDLLIFADQEHSVRQRDYVTAGEGRRATAFGTPGPDNPISPEMRRAAMQREMETAWLEYRRKTGAELERLLGMLKGKRL